jgi:hypothetical protein
VQNPSDHADGSGLAARAGDADAKGGVVEELGEKFCAFMTAAPTRRAACTSGTVSSTAAEATKI